MTPRYIIIHHTASPRDTTTLEQVNAWHKARGFPKSSRGWYVGYHFLITAGSMFQTRDENERGAHAYNPATGIDWNGTSLGVCLTGNFNEDKTLTEYQTQTLHNILRILMENWKIGPKRILLHRDVDQTACPGRNIDKAYIRGIINFDPYYGKKRTWATWMFKEQPTRAYLMRYLKRAPTEEEINGAVYGAYSKEEIRDGNYSLFKSKYA